MTDNVQCYFAPAATIFILGYLDYPGILGLSWDIPSDYPGISLVKVTDFTAWVPGESVRLYSTAPGEGDQLYSVDPW